MSLTMSLACNPPSPSSPPSPSAETSETLENADIDQYERQLYEWLTAGSLSYRRFDHPRVFTVVESRELAGSVPGLEIRNLFVRDRKRRFFLLCLPAEQSLDLKALSQSAEGASWGIAGRLSFASPEDLTRLLKVEAGAVNPFALLFDEERAVTLVLDRKIADSDKFNAHPMRNDRSIVLEGADFLRLLEQQGREATLFDFARLPAKEAS